MPIQPNHAPAVQSYWNERLQRVNVDARRYHVYYWGANPAHYDNPVHKHSFYEICYAADGKGSYWEGNRTYPLNPGTLFLSRPERLHQIRSDSGLFLLFIAFDAFPPESEGAERPLPLAIAETERFWLPDAADVPAVLVWEALFQQSAALRADDPAPQRAEALALRLAGVLMTALEQAFTNVPGGSSGKPGRTSNAAQLLNQAKWFICGNASLPLRLRDVVAYLHVSERHVNRLFTEELGMSFTRYLNAVRIRKASDLLRETDKPLAEVAAACDFDSVHYFTRVFKRATGLPPGRYRGRQSIDPFAPTIDSD